MRVNRLNAVEKPTCFHKNKKWENEECTVNGQTATEE